MGNTYSLFKELFPGQPRWSVDQIPDLTGQVIIVTGQVHITACLNPGTDYEYYRGNAGIGKETCKVYFSHLSPFFTIYIVALHLGPPQKRRKGLHGYTQQVQG